MECSSCYVGESCQNDSYGQSIIMSSSDIIYSELLLLRKRVGLEEINSICTYHYKKYVDKYQHLFGNSCCDPFSFHKKVITKNLREVTVGMCEKWPMVKLIPGKSVCSSCRKRLASSNEGDDDSAKEEPFTAPDIVLGSLNEAAGILGVSPIKIMKLSDEKKHLEVKRTMKKFSCAIKQKLSDSFNEQCELEEENDEEKNRKTIDVVSKDIEYLIQSLKERIKSCTSNSERIKVISVAPKSWSKTKTAEELGVSEYLVKKTRALVEKHGVIPEVNLVKPGRRVKKETKDLVVKFYNSDEVSRMCPGMKDVKSVRLEDGSKELKQKRLCLSNLKELYQKFKEEHPSVKLGFSKFCELRPKECILAGASGTHSVCVCLSHQNVKLMASEAKINDWKSLLQKVVCDVNNEKCMLGECPNCPSIEALKLHELNPDLDDSDEDNEKTIAYKQWVTTDHCNLITVVETISEFKENLASKLLELKSHHFIAQSQSQFLKMTKENLSQDECIVIGDFSENYTVVVQDEIQSYHWVNAQATIHPFCVYFKTDSADDLCIKSLCIISACIVHNTTAVYAFQKQLVPFVQTFIPNLKKIYYFSDGSGAQYKNRKNFSNLCKHKQDFGVNAEWHFFATSHGKGPCDGIGGTVKRLVAKASLQRPTEGHILTSKDMYEFCVENIKGTNFIMVTESAIKKEQVYLNDRFNEAQRFEGTRDHHCYIPKDSSTLLISRISAAFHNNHVEFRIDGSPRQINFSEITENDYVVCVYNKRWYVGTVIEMSKENNDVKVMFFKPGGPSTSFTLQRNDVVWVKLSNIIDVLTPCDFTTATGRTYNITQQKNTELSLKLQAHLKK